MAEGKFGLPRPFAVEKELVTMRLLTDEDINEAEISSSNGFVIMGELKPFYEIDGVDKLREQQIGGETIQSQVNIRIDTEDSFAKLQDMKNHLNLLNENLENRLFPSDVEIIPSITVNRRLAESSQIPKLIMRLETNRGTFNEFVDSVSRKVEEAPVLNRVLETKQSDGTNIVFVLADGINMKDASDLANELTGPRNKKTTDVFFDAVGVEE